MSRPRKLRSRKAGLPPGSLIHIGEPKVEVPSFSLIDFDADGLSESSALALDALPAQPPERNKRWFNAYGTRNPADLGMIGKQFGLHPLVLEDILNTTQRQKVDNYPDYLFLILHRYELQSGGLALTQDQIALVIGHDHLLSFQERPSQTFEPIRQRLRNAHSPLRAGGIDTLAYSLIDAVVDSYFAIIEQLNEHAESLEAEILGRPASGALEGIHQFKRCVSQLRRNLHPLRELLGTLHRDGGTFFRPEIQIYLRDVHDHTVHILESLEDLRDLATGLLDVYLSTVSHRVNLEVRTLTVVATIFMPATLIAGVFGMNFREMPWIAEAEGFGYALGLMLIVALAMLLAFWRRRAV